LKHWTAILFPVFLALFLYRRSFRIWFLADDFAWLGLGLSVSNWSGLVDALFSPMAQGTIRTLSERLFFLGFERTFGLESLPMRLASFATLAIALILLALIVRRLSGSLGSAVLASILWSLNFGVTIAMSWLSSYNQILLSALFLGAFYCFLQYSDSRKPLWLAGAWISYLLGFGALESIIVLPPVLLFWAFLFHRPSIRTAIPFFGPAILFALAHLFWIPKAKDAAAYRMYFDASLFESIAVYWDWLLGAERLIHFDPGYLWMVQLSHFVLTPALLAFLIWRTLKRDYLPLFFAFVSLALIGPMLPLRDHRTDYYLASASIGVVAVMALAPGRLPPLASRLSFLLLALYAVPSFIVQQASFEWYLERTAPLRPLLRGLAHAATLHPGKLILLEGVSEAVYGSSIADSALRLIPRSEVRLVPGSLPLGNPVAIAPAAARAAFESQNVVVYRFDGVRLHDVTREWERSKARALASGLSPEILAGDPAFGPQFLDGWYQIEDTHRWMAKSAQVSLGGPFPVGAKLFLNAFAPKELESFQLQISAAGVEIYNAVHSSGPMELSAPIPPSLLDRTELQVSIQSSRALRPPADNRILSILVTRISIR